MLNLSQNYFQKMSKILITTLNQLKQSPIVGTTVQGTRLIAIKADEKISVMEGNCPHEGTDLSNGELKSESIICPSHKWSFNLQTGEASGRENKLQVFEAIIEDENIYINQQDFESWKQDKNTSEKKEVSLTLKDLPSPKGVPLLGNLLDWEGDKKHLVLEKWAKECGDLFNISLAGLRFLVTANPDINIYILKNRPKLFRRFPKMAEIIEEMGVHGSFTAEGEEWVRHRKITAQALNMNNVKRFFPIIRQMTERLQNRWSKMISDGASFDLQQEMMRYTVDITTNIAFGYDTDTMGKDEDVIQKHLEKVFPAVNYRITAPFPTWRYFKTKKDKSLDQALSEVESTVNHLIQEAKKKLETKKTPSNFLEALLIANEEDKSFTDLEVFGNVFTMLLAGEDTTSNSISWTIYYISQHPEIEQKIREEASKVLTGTMATDVEELEQMDYIEAVIMESLRLQPVAPALYHQTLEDVTVEGLFIPKGTNIMAINKTAQTKEQYFTNADQFKPERWLAAKGGCPVHQKHTPEVFRTFGAGSRFCPGKNLAMFEMKMAISMIYHNYNIKLVPKPEEVKEVYAFTLMPENLIIELEKIKEQDMVK